MSLSKLGSGAQKKGTTTPYGHVIVRVNTHWSPVLRRLFGGAAIANFRFYPRTIPLVMHQLVEDVLHRAMKRATKHGDEGPGG